MEARHWLQYATEKMDHDEPAGISADEGWYGHSGSGWKWVSRSLFPEATTRSTAKANHNAIRFKQKTSEI